MADTLKRVESFAFDSKADGYDDDGYPIYDRAVGASVLRDAFKQFFSDGIFGTPADALMVSKGTGLSVSLAAGTFIINGAIATVQEPLSLKLADSAPKGRTPYGIMIRYDENSTYRSCYIRVATGTPSSSPVAPEPETGTAGVKEYRIGWVDVPSGATDLSKATVYDERGTSCPYAAPFESIDTTTFFIDLKNRGTSAYEDYIAFLNGYRSLVDAALGGTAAGDLQAKIGELQSTLSNADFWAYVNSGSESSNGSKHTTAENLRDFRAKTSISYLSDSEFMTEMVNETPSHPSYGVNVSNAAKLYKSVAGYVDRLPASSYSWSELKSISDEITNENKAQYYQKYKRFVGQKIPIPLKSVLFANTEADIDFTVVGVCHDKNASGKPLLLTLMPSIFVIAMNGYDTASYLSSGKGWANSNIRTLLNTKGAIASEGYLYMFPDSLVSNISPALKDNDQGGNTVDKMWLASHTEVGLGGSVGTVYEYFSANSDDLYRYRYSSDGEDISNRKNWYLRTVDNGKARLVLYSGLSSVSDNTNSNGILPGFCI